MKYGVEPGHFSVVQIIGSCFNLFYGGRENPHLNKKCLKIKKRKKFC